MFTPIAPDIARTVAKGGTIEFRPFEGWERQAIKKYYFMGVPHVIIYHVKLNELMQTYPNELHWFTCKMSVLNRILIVNDIELSPTSLLSTKNKKVQKPLVHMALGIVADASMELALKHKKGKIIVGSALSGFADVLLERNFAITTQDLFDNIHTTKRIKGLKRLQEVC